MNFKKDMLQYYHKKIYVSSKEEKFYGKDRYDRFWSEGMGLLEDIILPREHVEMAAVCDLYEDRAEEAKKS